MSNALQIIQTMQKAGQKDLCSIDIDLNFTSDEKDKLVQLCSELRVEFAISEETIEKLSFFRKEYEMSLKVGNVLMTKDLITYLSIYLYKMSELNDCVLGDWGAFINNSTSYNINTASIESLVDEGQKYYEDKKWYLAFVNFTIVTLKANHSEAHYNLGCLKYELGVVKDAINSFDKAIEYDSNNIVPFLNRGVAYYAIGDFKRSIQDYETVIRHFPKNPDPYLNAANAYVQLKNKGKAIAYYDKAIELGSEDAKHVKETGLRLLNKS
ncbi:MAG: tetratricopeptide repeat protein [Planctomycetes bacterium]|nr:tetratricopeptide repeat protein [Planctomycetota bacterium]